MKPIKITRTLILTAMALAGHVASAQTIVTLSQVDLYSSAFVVDGSLDIDSPSFAATGTQNWVVSASSAGNGSGSTSGSFTSDVSADTFELSGTAQGSFSGANAGGNGSASGLLRVDFTVPILSEGYLFTVANLANNDVQGNSFGFTRLILEEDNIEIARLERFTSGSLNQTIDLSPGKSYTVLASIEAILGNSIGSFSASANSVGTGITVTPVPEPSTLMITITAVVAGLIKRRRGGLLADR